MCRPTGPLSGRARDRDEVREEECMKPSSCQTPEVGMTWRKEGCASVGGWDMCGKQAREHEAGQEPEPSPSHHSRLGVRPRLNSG